MNSNFSRLPRRITLAAVFMLTANTVNAADLLQIYLDALANDARYAAARAQYEADQEKIVQGRSNLLPTIAASAGANRNDDEAKDLQGNKAEKRYNSESYALQLTVPLFRPKNWRQYQEGALQTELAEST
ncbi:MAG: TolC family protein, partial [Azoarcus sp.]|nr:TolC family protein [Azoarcus sp.]